MDTEHTRIVRITVMGGRSVAPTPSLHAQLNALTAELRDVERRKELIEAAIRRPSTDAGRNTRLHEALFEAMQEEDRLCRERQTLVSALRKAA